MRGIIFIMMVSMTWTWNSSLHSLQSLSSLSYVSPSQLISAIETTESEKSLKNVSASCLAQLKDMAMHFKTAPIPDMLLNSGIGINHLGNYKICKGIPDIHYILLKIDLGSAEAFDGLCVPRGCKIADLALLDETLLPLLQSLSTHKITLDMIHWVNAEEENSKVNNFSAGLIVTLVLAAIMVILVCIGSTYEILKWSEKKSRQIKEKEAMFKIAQRYTTSQLASIREANQEDDLTDEEIYEERMMAVYEPDSSETHKQKIQPSKSTLAVPMSEEKPINLHIPSRKKVPPSAIWKILGCFSIVRNTDWILHSTNSLDENLDIMNGIKVLALGWSIVGNTYIMLAHAPVFDLEHLQSVLFDNYSMCIIILGELSIDVFFFLSGFLVTLQLTQICSCRTNRNIVTFLKAFVHRYLKLFPFYVLCLLLAMYIFPRLSSGPLYFQAQTNANLCKDNWYKNVLYFNNFFTSTTDQCNGWTWYIANDMQFFVLSPFILVPFCLSQLWGYIVILLLALASFLAQGFIIYYYDLSPSLQVDYNQVEMSKKYFYVAPWCRVNPFFVGMLLCFGYLSYRQPEKFRNRFWDHINKRIRESMLVRCACYLSGFLLTYAMVHIMYIYNNWGEGKPSWIQNAAYMATMRPGFVFGMGIAIYPVLLGRAKLLHALLGYSFFGVLSRLTYGAYMSYISILLFIFFSQSEGFYFRHFTCWMFIIFTFVISYLFSFFGTLVMESPIAQLEKNYIFPDLKKKSQEEFNWPCSVLVYQNKLSFAPKFRDLDTSLDQ